MADRKPTRAERKAEIELLINLAEQSAFLENLKLRQSLIPSDWHALERTTPVEPRRERVTLRVEARTLRWFRALGPGWQRRADKVLQAYMLSLISKEIEAQGDRDSLGNLI